MFLHMSVQQVHVISGKAADDRLCCLDMSIATILAHNYKTTLRATIHSFPLNPNYYWFCWFCFKFYWGGVWCGWWSLWAWWACGHQFEELVSISPSGSSTVEASPLVQLLGTLLQKETIHPWLFCGPRMPFYGLQQLLSWLQVKQVFLT